MRSPTKEQCKIFKNAGVDYRMLALGAMSKNLMQKAGATYHADRNKAPEFLGPIFSRPSDEWNYRRYMETAILGHPMTGGGTGVGETELGTDSGVDGRRV